MTRPNSASLAGSEPETPSSHTAPSSSLSTKHNGTHHRRTSSGWSETAADRPAGTPLVAFAVDPEDDTRDALTAHGKSSWILTECVNAVNVFSESPCFKALLRLLLERCIAALSVELPADANARLTAQHLHDTITKKLQLSIIASPCGCEQHIMETKPATGEIRIDTELLKHLRSIPQPPPGATNPTTAAIKALVMVKLLHEVAHQHTRGLMFHISTVCGPLYLDRPFSNDTPPKLCPYLDGRQPKTKFASKGRPIWRGEMGIAMETVLLGSYFVQLPADTAYADLTTLIAVPYGVDGDNVNVRHITRAGIDRLQPERFTAECQDRGTFFIFACLEPAPKRRKTGDMELGELCSAIKCDEGDDVADQLDDTSEAVSTVSESDDEYSDYGYETRYEPDWKS